MNSTNVFLDYLPIAMMFVVSVGFVGLVMALTHWMGPHKKSAIKNDTFECGIEPQGNARTPFSIKYFLVAILFVLFDVEIIFMYTWAINFKKLGLFGLIEMFCFMAVFAIGLLYIYRKGALKWE